MKKGKKQCRNFGFGAASFFCVFCPRWVARPTTFPPALFPVGDWGGLVGYPGSSMWGILFLSPAMAM